MPAWRQWCTQEVQDSNLNATFNVIQGGYLFKNIDVKFLLIFKFANQGTKEPFVSLTIKAQVGTLITIGDVIDIFAIGQVSENVRWRKLNE